MPQGAFFKVARESDKLVIDPRHWQESIPAEAVAASCRRARGQFFERREEGITAVRPEPYEKRLLRLLLLARKNLAELRAREGKHAEAAALYESILKLDPWMGEEPTAVLPLATLCRAQKFEQAEAMFRRRLP